MYETYWSWAAQQPAKLNPEPCLGQMNEQFSSLQSLAQNTNHTKVVIMQNNKYFS